MPLIRRVAEKAGLSGDRAEHEAEVLLDAVRRHEPDARAGAALPRDYWASLDDYRRTVPMLRSLAR